MRPLLGSARDQTVRATDLMSNTSTWWDFVVDFGDIAVLGPATCATCLTLWLRGHRHEASIRALSFAGCVTATVLMKATIGFVDVDLAGHRLVLKSPPSGHTAMSVAFYGSLAAFLWAALPPAWGRAAAAVLAVLTGLIGDATIILKWHTSFDVLAGLLVGVIFTVVLARTAHDRPGSVKTV